MGASVGTAPLLDVKDLHMHFHTRRGVVRALNGVTFSLKRGEVMGIVGESGSGKTMTGLSILGLLPKPAGRIVSGEIIFDGQDLVGKQENEMEKVRGKRIGMIAQEPTMALNPVFSIQNQVGEPFQIHEGIQPPLLWKKVRDILALVRIPEPEKRMNAFPHQMSGGMCQRIVTSMSLACSPQLLICDEPTTALDVTTQIQIIALLKDLQDRLNMAMIFITHDFGIVGRICQKVCVMYAGVIVEESPTADLFANPLHPYSRALIGSVPDPDKKVARLTAIKGQPPSLYNKITGCVFAPRCEDVMQKCREVAPPECEVNGSRRVSCWRMAKWQS